MAHVEDRWTVVDGRTGFRVTMGSFPKAYAEQTVADWKARDARGKRPDCHHFARHIVVAPEPAPWPPPQQRRAEPGYRKCDDTDCERCN